MLYLIQFYFDVWEDDDDEEESMGHMACFLEAGDIHGATSSFRNYILELRNSCDLFKEITAIYLDSIIEIERGSTKAVTIYEWTGEEGNPENAILVDEPFIAFPPYQEEGQAEERHNFIMRKRHLRLIKSDAGKGKNPGGEKSGQEKNRRHLRLIQGHARDKKLFR